MGDGPLGTAEREEGRSFPSPQEAKPGDPRKEGYGRKGTVPSNERPGDSQAEELGTSQQWIRDHLRSQSPLPTQDPGARVLSPWSWVLGALLPQTQGSRPPVAGVSSPRAQENKTLGLPS